MRISRIPAEAGKALEPRRDGKTAHNLQQPRYLAIISRRLAPLNEKWGKSRSGHAGELISPCRLSLGLRPVNAERAETWRHGEGGELAGREWKRTTSWLPLGRRSFFGKGLCAVFVAPLRDRKRINRCVRQPRNSPSCLRASARSALTGRRPFEGGARR